MSNWQKLPSNHLFCKQHANCNSGLEHVAPCQSRGQYHSLCPHYRSPGTQTETLPALQRNSAQPFSSVVIVSPRLPVMSW